MSTRVLNFIELNESIIMSWKFSNFYLIIEKQEEEEIVETQVFIEITVQN